MGCPISFGLNHIPDPPVRETTAIAPLWGVGFKSQKPSLCRSGKAVVPQPCPPSIPCEHSVHDPETNFFVLEGKNHLWECGPLDRYIITPGKNPSKWWPSLRPKRGGEVRTQNCSAHSKAKPHRLHKTEPLSDTQVTVHFLSIPVQPAQTFSSTESNLEPKVVTWTKTGLMVGGEGSPRQTNPPQFPQALGPFHCTQELGYCTDSSSSHTLW